MARLEPDVTIPRMDTMQKVALAFGLRLELVSENEEAAATEM